MKKLIHICWVALLTLGISACDDFGDLNVNPNLPVRVAPATLITNAERGVSDAIGSALGTLYAQQISDITYTDDSRYVGIQADFSAWYTGPLADLQRVIELNTNEETRDAAAISGPNENQIAVAMILKSYFYHHLTDRWGPIPYSESLRAQEGILTPAYDSQQEVYYGLFEDLKAAVAMIDEAAGGIEGDFILNGDMAQWKRFANTIRLIMALRIADVDAEKGRAEFTAALAAGVLEETVFYPYLAETANENPWYARFITRTDYAVSELMVNSMKATNDPRLTQFADPTLSSGTEIVGMPYGLATSAVNPEDVSFPNSTYVKAQDAPLAIYSEAQIKFTLAEAAVRGWITDDAEQLYREGIMASWDQWGVSYTPEQFEAYYNQPQVKWDAARWKELIGYQKWVALYLQGYEAWAEWRRLDEPSGLIVPESPLNPSAGIPLRNMYPNNEANLNATNYEDAVRMLGGPDVDGTALWWDVN